MPKDNARIWLEVTGVRCERLKDITEVDAIAEGIESWDSPVHEGKKSYQDYLEPGKQGIDCPFISPITSFMTLWQNINGKDSWSENPWVWVYEFKRVHAGPIKLKNAIIDLGKAARKAAKSIEEFNKQISEQQ